MCQEVIELVRWDSGHGRDVAQDSVPASRLLAMPTQRLDAASGWDEVEGWPGDVAWASPLVIWLIDWPGGEDVERNGE